MSCEIAVAPVLEELGGRPRVIDLVEVHLVRLGQPEHAEAQRGDDQDDQEPQVEPVEPAAALARAGSRCGPGGRALVEPRPGTSRRPDLATTTGGRSHAGTRRRAGRRHGGAAVGRRAAAASDRAARRAPTRTGRGDRHRCHRRPLAGVGLAAVRRAPSSSRRAGPRGRSWSAAPRRTPTRVTSAIARHPDLGPDRLGRSPASRDRGLSRVERGQDDVHVGEHRHRSGRRRRPASATRSRRGSTREREEREAVALVDAGRERRRTRAPGRRAPTRSVSRSGRRATTAQDDERSPRPAGAAPTAIAGTEPEHARARRRSVGRVGSGVADPLAAFRPGCCPGRPATSAHRL